MRPDVFLVLIFPDSSEFRWVDDVPRVGSEIRSRTGQRWRVEETLQSGVATYTVYCGAKGRSLGATLDLAGDLLVSARRSLLRTPKDAHK
jgi:hypothetical protein